MKTKFGLCLAAVLMSLNVARAAEPPAAIDPKARAVVAGFSSLLRQTDAFSVDVDMTVLVQMGGMRNEVPLSFSFFRQKPDRFALVPRGEPGMMSRLSIFDGTNLYTYTPLTKTYSVTPVPPGMDLSGLATPGLTGGSFFEVLMAKDPEKTIFEDVNEAKHLGTETFAGKPCVHLALSEEQITWEMWADTGTNPLVRKVAADLSKMVAAAMADQNAGMAAMMKDAKMTATLLFTNWVMPAKIPAERFRFTPPAGATLESDEDEDENQGLVGEPAPKFKLKLYGGGEFDLAAQKGSNVVILDFWATWCLPCARSLPIVAEVAQAYEKRGVVFIAVNEQDEPEDIEKFLAKHKLKLKVALDPEGDVGESYNLESIPQTVVIDRNGVVHSVHVGAVPDLKSKLTNALESVLGAKPAEKKSP